ncbi:S8 family serine peptidase [Bacillus sp. FJAT-26390]|uniref:S8 family peptidase n=1 Tax=Bacillus sp. FJAT-26390 TaxID=1743142 RepID=UPI00080806FC|nr:S8 family serine peptidase [Bacillus sp. FJAT-26390]OBZ13788.1 hypothetical protein A7975_13365 [Bacillus sp. FJAT-26390]
MRYMKFRYCILIMSLVLTSLLCFYLFDIFKVKQEKVPIIAIIDTGLDIRNKKMIRVMKSGYNAINPTDSINDDNGHGTLMANIIMNLTDKKIQILAIKAFDSLGNGKTNNIETALKYIIKEEVDIILFSSSFSYLPETTRSLISEANNKDIIVVAAAGNNNTDVSYPARFPEVIAVGASDNSARANYSNYGYGLEFLAQGNLGTAIPRGHENRNVEGSSISAARVTALISNLLANENFKVGNDNIRSFLLGAIREKNNEWSFEKGLGVLSDNKVDSKNSQRYLSIENGDSFPVNTILPVKIGNFEKYSITVPIDGELKILVSDYEKFNLSLYDEKKNRVSHNYGKYLVEKGEYFLEIRTKTPNKPVNTQLLIDLTLIKDKYEFNNTIDKAFSLNGVNFPLTLNFDEVADTDFFNITTKKNIIEITVNPIWGYCDISISLYDTNEFKLLEIDDNGINEVEKLKYKTVPGNYYIQIENKLKSDESSYSIIGSW